MVKKEEEEEKVGKWGRKEGREEGREGGKEKKKGKKEQLKGEWKEIKQAGMQERKKGCHSRFFQMQQCII